MNLFQVFPLIIVFTMSADTFPLPLVSDIRNNEIIPGGVGNFDKPATAEIQALIKTVHPEIASRLLGYPGGRNIRGEIRPISYRTQLVNGVNYFVKVAAQTPKKSVYFHIRIFKGFDGTTQLIKVIGPKQQNDEISFF